MNEKDDRSSEPMKAPEGKVGSSGDQRQRRLAEALRRNLRRRKGVSADTAANAEPAGTKHKG